MPCRRTGHDARGIPIDNAHAHLSCLNSPTCEAGGYLSICSTSPADWEQTASAALQNNRVIPSFGIHPWFLEEDMSSLPDELEAYLKQFPHAGVGETGLDKSRKASASLDIQREILSLHIKLARQYDRVISLHCVRAWGSLLDILQEHRPHKILLHGWKGHESLTSSFIELDCYFSIGGTSLSSDNANEWLSLIPEDRILLETDDATETLESTFSRLKELRQQDEWREQLHHNFVSLFGLES